MTPSGFNLRSNQRVSPCAVELGLCARRMASLSLVLVFYSVRIGPKLGREKQAVTALKAEACKSGSGRGYLD